MRKKILGATFVVAIMTVAGFNAYMNQPKNEMSELALKNVEALANEEENKQPATCGTETEDVNELEPCQMDNGAYSEGFVGVKYSETTGTDNIYYVGMSGMLYDCLSSSGKVVDDVKQYDCGEDILGGFF